MVQSEGGIKLHLSMMEEQDITFAVEGADGQGLTEFADLTETTDVSKISDKTESYLVSVDSSDTIQFFDEGSATNLNNELFRVLSSEQLTEQIAGAMSYCIMEPASVTSVITTDEKKDEQKAKTRKTYQCDICPKIFSRVDELHSHLAQHARVATKSTGKHENESSEEVGVSHKKKSGELAVGRKNKSTVEMKESAKISEDNVENRSFPDSTEDDGDGHWGSSRSTGKRKFKKSSVSKNSHRRKYPTKYPKKNANMDNDSDDFDNDDNDIHDDDDDDDERGDKQIMSIRTNNLPFPPKSEQKSILDMNDEVGRKLRRNFSRLLNSDGPEFVTCRQCIMQVNRARVFNDRVEEIPILLEHLQLHEEIQGENEPNIESTSNASERKRTSNAPETKMTTNASEPKMSNQISDIQESSIVTFSEEAAVDPSFGPVECSACNITLENTDDIIQHCSVHKNSGFSLKAVKSGENITDMENVQFNIEVEPFADGKLNFGFESSRVLERACKVTGLESKKKKRRKKMEEEDMMIQIPRSQTGPFICIECADRFESCAGLRDHMTKLHGDRHRVFVCKSCDTTYSEKNFADFEAHLNFKHQDEDIHCCFCNLTFKTPMDIKYHVAQHRPPLNFSCPYCYHEFSWILEGDFSAHVRSHENEENPFSCRECQAKFPDFISRREHQRFQMHDSECQVFRNDARPFICTGCGKQFMSTGKPSSGLRALRQHVCVSRVTLDPRFKCNACDAMFPLARLLRLHIRQKHEHHMCHMCGTVCTSKAILDEHVGMLHHGGNFACDVCGDMFDTSQKMKQHKTREHGSRDYICEFCGQGFAARLLLVRHLKRHDEFTGFVCSVCGDKFLLADRLENHFRKYHADIVVATQDYDTVVMETFQNTNDAMVKVHSDIPM